MKNELMYILITVLLWVPISVALNQSTVFKNTPGIDLSFGWARPQLPPKLAELRASAQCVQGTGPFTQGFPFYSEKHDGIQSCEPAYENKYGYIANSLIALFACGIIVYISYALIKRNRRLSR